MFRRKLGIVFGTMLAFMLVSILLIRAYGRERMEGKEGDIVIAASFYPVYVLAENLIEGCDGVQLVSLTENHTGCLHDYQLTTKDMLTLETADILVLNGGNMEAFLTEVVLGRYELSVIDSCADMDFLMGKGHRHEESQKEGGEEAADSDASEPNGHVWMDFGRYQKQLHAIADELCRLDAKNAAIYRRNEESYQKKVQELQTEQEGLLAGLAGMKVIIFHDAFEYLCDMLGMEVVHGIDLDADAALNAGEIAEITDEIRQHHVRYLLAEEATGAIAEQIAKTGGCQVIYLDPLTSGRMDADAYLDGMKKNMESLGKIAAFAEP